MLDALHLPATLTTHSGDYLLRDADERDLDGLMRLLADDAISASRGDVDAVGDRPLYLRALQTIVGEPTNALLVVEATRRAQAEPVGEAQAEQTGATDAEPELLATMQLTRVPGMARRGSTRILVEAVRVRSDQRSTGIGTAMMRWVTDVAAPALGSSLVQLTSDAARADAHRFYERLGFVPSHVGFKFHVGQH